MQFLRIYKLFIIPIFSYTAGILQQLANMYTGTHVPCLNAAIHDAHASDTHLYV